MTIADEVKFLKGFSKPLRNVGYDEIAALGDDGTFADLKLIDKKTGITQRKQF